MTPALKVENLVTELALRRGVLRPVDGVSFHVDPSETLGIVGESGSGKSMTCLSLLRLLPKPGGRIASGSVVVGGRDLTRLSEEELARDWRGRRISMVTQDPMTSLNPVYTVGDQVGAPLRYHRLAEGMRAVRAGAAAVLGRVRIPSPESRLDEYPHQFSGGMRQRVVSAMAIACEPEVMIADEPTSNLDVTIQVKMIDLYRKIQEETGVAIVLITHDMGVAASICDRIAVMYAGRIVETGPARRIFRAPAHPYTRALLDSIPRLGRKSRRLTALGGQPPDLANPPTGCRFAPRCALRVAKCAAYPPDAALGEGHSAACWLAGNEADHAA
ncbi:peptide/nickel transport system ATP-binding protein [Albimonas donghaensis]|uniref:Peptide/nickel transport system ATP-binding protein n=1 Tax=Albimonas donghaensis TaxID=356660 RepID=A0A1H3G5Y5_9RHOB|nr:ABC transporter ATP-binding protein [Albimonas donghaensis]SDX98457.1 peptide/nickel transport system ATP-binding protein [Albimonas donghaensis]